jgi:Ni,Fe-hydrogenase III large subunit
MKNNAVLNDFGSAGNHAVIANGGALPLAELPLLSYEKFAAEVLLLMGSGARVAAYFAVPPTGGSSEYEIFAVLGLNPPGHLAVLRGKLSHSFLSLTPQCPQLHLFEREIAEQYGLVAKGHPWLKPVRFHAVWNGGQDAWQRDAKQHPVPGDMEYFQVEGDEVHEVAVGPVHAGVIEPGHFRFQCFGEKVLHLEISLGYQHRGIEQLLTGGPHAASASQIETIAGDTTIGHMTAYCQALEALAGASVPARARQIRAIALELERLANHVGDFGALAADVGFLPTSAFCGRLRGDYLNMSAAICGSRFGRGLVRPGGVVFDLEPDRQQRLIQHLNEVAVHTRGALDLFLNAPSVLGRLEGVGVVAAEDAAALGLVGVAGRACGQDCDVRRHYPIAQAASNEQGAIIEATGDVLARAKVRRREVQAAIDFVRQESGQLLAGELSAAPGALAPSSLAVSLVEGWRGQIAHVAITDGEGRIGRYKVVDPSFFNWNGLAMALRNEEISDFPLCNKSFNLSYCGYDL